jgi:hypothetical protein
MGFVAGTLVEGQAAGRFRPTNPLLFHLSVLAPILVVFASADFRERVLSSAVPALPQPTLADLSAHVSDVLARLVVSHP